MVDYVSLLAAAEGLWDGDAFNWLADPAAAAAAGGSQSALGVDNSKVQMCVEVAWNLSNYFLQEEATAGQPTGAATGVQSAPTRQRRPNTRWDLDP